MDFEEKKGSPEVLFSFRPRCGEITSLKYVNIGEGKTGIVSG